MTGKLDIDWFYRNLFAYRNGNLDGRSTLRFEQMLAASSECREALEAARVLEQVEKDTADLIPTRVIARWDEIAPKLSDAERELVLRHLERSEESQEDLRLLGINDPRAGLAAPSESAVEAASTSTTLGRGGTGDLIEATQALVDRFRRWAWAMGLYAAAATALIGFLVLRMSRVGPAPERLEISAPLHILTTTRSGDADTIVVSPKTAYLVLGPSGQKLSPEQDAVSVRLFDPGQRIIHLSEARSGTRSDSRITIVVQNPDPWEPGLHKLSLEEPRSGQVLAEYVFLLIVQ